MDPVAICAAPNTMQKHKANRTAENRTTPALDARSPAMVVFAPVARLAAPAPDPASAATSGTTRKPPGLRARRMPACVPFAAHFYTPVLAARVRAPMSTSTIRAAPPPGAAAASAPSLLLICLIL